MEIMVQMLKTENGFIIILKKDIMEMLDKKVPLQQLQDLILIKIRMIGFLMVGMIEHYL